jgi:hypothetical protein
MNDQKKVQNTRLKKSEDTDCQVSPVLTSKYLANKEYLNLISSAIFKAILRMAK